MLRDQFLLRDDVTFLNHGSFGACPQPVFAGTRRLQRELEAEPVDFLHPHRTLPTRLAAARARLADFLGADRDEIVFVTNATRGLNVVARSVALEPGRRGPDHRSRVRGHGPHVALLCASSRTRRYVRRPCRCPLDDPAEVVEAVWSRRDRPHPGPVPQPHHLALGGGPAGGTADRPGPGARHPHHDRRRPCARADRLRPARPGLRTSGSGNCHKWLMAPKGAAASTCGARCRTCVEPLVVSWGWESDHPGPSRFVDEQEWTGTRDSVGVPGGAGGPGLLRRRHDWPAVRRQCRALLLEARAAAAGGGRACRPCARPIPGWPRCAAVPLPAGTDVEAFGRALREDHAVEVPVTSFAGRPWLRFSVQGYNTAEDVARLVEAVRSILG